MTAAQSKKIDDLMTNIYRDLYKNSTPSADFDELVANATLNEQGQKVIPFDDYELESEVFEKILDEHLSKSKLPQYIKGKVRVSIYLGCSPKTKLG